MPHAETITPQTSKAEVINSSQGTSFRCVDLRGLVEGVGAGLTGLPPCQAPKIPKALKGRAPGSVARDQLIAVDGQAGFCPIDSRAKCGEVLEVAGAALRELRKAFDMGTVRWDM